MEKKSAKQRLAYELVYPAILGSIVYEMLPLKFTEEYFINLLLGLFFCLDCYHLFFFMEDEFTEEQKDTWTYVLFDILVAILFWVAAKHLFIDDAFYAPLISITIIPLCFLVYSITLKYNVRFYKWYFGIIIALSLVTGLLYHYNKGNYLLYFILITTLIYGIYVTTRKKIAT